METQFKRSAELVNHNLNIFKDDVTRNKISRHLMDINDTITEEDIRNIKVNIPSEYSVEFKPTKKSR